MTTYKVTFLDVKASQQPLAEGETFREARKVTVQGEAPSPQAALLRAWEWLKTVEAPRLVFPGEYVIYSDAIAVPLAPPQPRP